MVVFMLNKQISGVVKNHRDSYYSLSKVKFVKGLSSKKLLYLGPEVTMVVAISRARRSVFKRRRKRR